MNGRVLMLLRKTRHAMRRTKRGRIKRETMWRGAAVTSPPPRVKARPRATKSTEIDKTNKKDFISITQLQRSPFTRG